MYMLKKKRILKFFESINEALFLSMKKDKNVLLMGLGVDDPKGIFSTTLKLDKFFSNLKQFWQNNFLFIIVGKSLNLSFYHYGKIVNYQLS